MLILSRRIGESVVIGEDTYCTVLGIQGNQVRLGFAAPKHRSVHREEIYLKIQSENNHELLTKSLSSSAGLTII